MGRTQLLLSSKYTLCGLETIFDCLKNVSKSQSWGTTICAKVDFSWGTMGTHDILSLLSLHDKSRVPSDSFHFYIM
jgi:hypothetical protein